MRGPPKKGIWCSFGFPLKQPRKRRTTLVGTMVEHSNIRRLAPRLRVFRGPQCGDRQLLGCPGCPRGYQDGFVVYPRKEMVCYDPQKEYMYTCKYIHAYILSIYMHTYVHTYIHTYMYMFRSSLTPPNGHAQEGSAVRPTPPPPLPPLWDGCTPLWDGCMGGGSTFFLLLFPRPPL